MPEHTILELLLPADGEKKKSKAIGGEVMHHPVSVFNPFNDVMQVTQAGSISAAQLRACNTAGSNLDLFGSRVARGFNQRHLHSASGAWRISSGWPEEDPRWIQQDTARKGWCGGLAQRYSLRGHEG